MITRFERFILFLWSTFFYIYGSCDAMSSILLSIQRGFGLLSSKPIGTRDRVLEVVLMTRRVRVTPRVRVGWGKNSEYGSGTGTGNIMGYGSGSTNAVPADL